MIKSIVKRRRNSKLFSLIESISPAQLLFENSFEVAKNYKSYYPENNLNVVLRNMRRFSGSRRKSPRNNSKERAIPERKNINKQSIFSKSPKSVPYNIQN